MGFRVGLKLFLSVALVVSVTRGARAQQPAGTSQPVQQQGASAVRGTVADPDAAVIPGATVTLTPTTGKAVITQSQSDGTYSLNGVAPGTYSLTITMPNFATFVRQGIRITAGQAVTVNVKMAIQEADQVVQVTAQANTLSVDQDSNASSTVIKGKDLEALSDDPDELSSELTALAGPAAGPNGGQIYVDGFTGGQLPPKSSIREIRVNQNPFSAQFDRLGYGRVEVFTKPGTDKFHGSAQLNANDSSFNTANPLLDQNPRTGEAYATPITQPPYHTIFFFGNMTGPIAKNASFSVGGSRRTIQDNAIINTPISAVSTTSTALCQPSDTTCTQTAQYQSAVTVPQTRWDISPRVDLALGDKNTLTMRYQYESNAQSNNGLGGGSVLPTAANNSTSSEQEIQISDTQIFSARVINETRFEFQRQKSDQAPVSTAPTLNVQGAFTAGGSASGSNHDTQDHIEVQNYTSIALAKNFIRMGGRLRRTVENNVTTAGTNGIFTYNDIASYQANTPSQFSITKVNGAASATSIDVGLYAEDDWKVRPNLTVSYGFRYETQNFLSEHHDFAPRLSFAYGLGSAKGTPKTVLRGGFGIFYDRFQLGNQLTTVQQNGLTQTRSVAIFRTSTTTTGQQCTPATIASCLAAVSASGNQTYTAAPNLRSPYTMQFAFGADQQLFRGATLSVNYLHAQGVHQFISQNVNAAANAPGTGTASGNTAPIIDQFQSEGDFRQNQLVANFNLRGSRRFSLFGYYALNFANSDTAGATSFPSVPNNIKADYGRATFSTRNRLFLGGNITAPHFVSISPFIIAASGTPYSITTGTDVNGDSVYNDRPQFADGSSGNCGVAANFITPTQPGYTPIPINSCTGPALFTMNVRAQKTFGFGKLTEAGAARAAQAAQGGPGPGGPGGPGGRGGPGGGRGGFGGGGGGSTGHRYNLSLGLQAQNVFNFHDYSTPVGTLTAQKNGTFGKSLQLAGGPYTSNSATERLQVFLSFNF